MRHESVRSIVLAVIVLWSFTAAYGSFTRTLVICQDPTAGTWAFTVHLYQFQMWADTSAVLAAPTLASLPTLVVFLMVQQVILRGISAPTYK